jgi:hypothetical protein
MMALQFPKAMRHTQNADFVHEKYLLAHKYYSGKSVRCCYGDCSKCCTLRNHNKKLCPLKRQSNRHTARFIGKITSIIHVADVILRFGSIHIIRHDTTRHDTARHDRIFLYGFHMLELTLVRHRQLTTKTASLRLREENTLPVY